MVVLNSFCDYYSKSSLESHPPTGLIAGIKFKKVQRIKACAGK
jgi:hypothetical protein